MDACSAAAAVGQAGARSHAGPQVRPWAPVRSSMTPRVAGQRRDTARNMAVKQ